MPPPIHPVPEDVAWILKKYFNNNKDIALPQTLTLHSYIRSIGLESHPTVGNLIVSVLTRRYNGLRTISLAHQVFNNIAQKHQITCDSLIIGYANCGEFQNALSLYQTLVADKLIHPSHTSEYVFVALLKSCIALKDLDSGCRLHADIIELNLLHKDVFIGSTLVDMYAKLGWLERAKDVFNTLRVRNMVSWTAMISALLQYGCDEEALFCLAQMQEQGISPSEVTYICTLKACANTNSRDRGHKIHVDIVKKGYENDAFIGSTLIDFYTKCGFLVEAIEIFDKISLKDVVLWTSLITGYIEVGCAGKALDNFEQMQEEGIPPNSTAFVAGLKSCGCVRDLDKGTRMYSDLIRKGMDKELYVANTLIDMYGKCGSVITAQHVFDKLVIPDIVSWNVLMAGYVENGLAEKALECFHHLKHKNMSPTFVTYVWGMKACGNLGASARIYELHADIIKIGIEENSFIGSTLIDGYVKYGSITEARKVFDDLSLQTIVSVNVLIAGYTEHGHEEEALSYVEQFMNEYVLLDVITLLCSLKACRNIVATTKGQGMHVWSVKMGLEKDYDISNTLIDMYSKCGLLREAQNVLMGMPSRDVFSWTALIMGYAEDGHGDNALIGLEEMQSEGICLDAVTLVCGLTACSSIKATENGQKLHKDIICKGLEQENLVGNTLIDMYAKFGWLTEVKEVFNKLRDLDVVSWNVLIAGYASDEDCYEEALEFFKTMEIEGFSADAITLVSCLIACSNMGSIDKGQGIHAKIVEKGFSDKDAFIGSTIVNMYTNFGLLLDAQNVFDKLLERSLVIWNTLIGGYAQLGAYETSLHIYERMIGEEGIQGDEVTFVSILNACSNAGKIEAGQSFYKSMIEHCCDNLMVTPEHHACMVDILSRAGCIDMAVAMLEKMPFQPGVVLWLTLLGSCRKWGNIEHGKLAFEHAIQLVEKDAAPYVCMFNIYADADAAI